MDSRRDVVTAMLDPEFRRYLAELFAEGDRLKASYEEDARAEAAAKRRASPPVSETVDHGATVAGMVGYDEHGAFPLAFNELQMGVIGHVIDELHREFDERLERATRR